jgi:hypothetical protein
MNINGKDTKTMSREELEKTIEDLRLENFHLVNGVAGWTSSAQNVSLALGRDWMEESGSFEKMALIEIENLKQQIKDLKALAVENGATPEAMEKAAKFAHHTNPEVTLRYNDTQK